MEFDNASYESQHIIDAEERQAYHCRVERVGIPLVRGEAPAELVEVQKKYRERKRVMMESARGCVVG